MGHLIRKLATEGGGQLHEVGHWEPSGKWHTLERFPPDQKEAAYALCSYLNGNPSAGHTNPKHTG